MPKKIPFDIEDMEGQMPSHVYVDVAETDDYIEPETGDFLPDMVCNNTAEVVAAYRNAEEVARRLSGYSENRDLHFAIHITIKNDPDYRVVTYVNGKRLR